MKWIRIVLPASILIASGGHAQLEELFSRHTQILRPRGAFAAVLVKASPGGGGGWRTIQVESAGLRLAAPAKASADTEAAGSRLVQVVLSDSPERPRPVFRVDRFEPGAGDSKSVDPDYAADYAEQYPDEAFAGKFAVSDSGYVLLKKPGTAFAMVGGTYLQGGARLYRLQWAYLSPERHLFATFDCAERDWGRYEEQVARMLLSLDVTQRRAK